ncbi:MAG: DUF1491 family protein [Litorimonas sp.]
MWIDALIRRAQVGGAFALVARQGDRDSGTVLVAVRSRSGLDLYVPERDMDGVRVWRAQEVDEATLAEVMERRADFDPDLCVVEIDDPQARHFIEEPVLRSGEAPAAQADAAAAARALFRDR